MAAEEASSAADVEATSGQLRASNLGERSPALDQATFFRAVENNNLPAISGLLKQGTVDVNALNTDGVNALLLALYQYEKRRNVGLITCLLENGADPNVPMAANCDRRICIVRQQSSQSIPLGSPPSASGTYAVGLGNTGSSMVSDSHSTKRIGLAGKTPLLVALELKSALYVKGWDYRHWDSMLNSLAFATVKSFEEADAEGAGKAVQSADAAAAARAAAVADGWAAVFASGHHETLEVWAEGKHLEVLKLVLVTNSKVLKNIVEAGQLQGVKGRVELKDASFTVVREIVSYLYSARLNHDFVKMRGVDLLVAAHKYQIAPLKEAIALELEANRDNWIKLVSVALEVGAPALVLKCAQSICATMEERSTWRSASRKPVFSSTMTPPVGNPELREDPGQDAAPIEVWRQSDLAHDTLSQVAKSG